MRPIEATEDSCSHLTTTLEEHHITTPITILPCFNMAGEDVPLFIISNWACLEALFSVRVFFQSPAKYGQGDVYEV